MCLYISAILELIVLLRNSLVANFECFECDDIRYERKLHYAKTWLPSISFGTAERILFPIYWFNMSPTVNAQ